MTLQVAPCPNCRGAVVFGERVCRTCGQTFDYGATPPPSPSPEQIVASLRAVGVVVTPAPPPAVSDESIFSAVADAVAAVRPSMGAGPAPRPVTAGSDLVDARAPALADFDQGRFDGVGGDVASEALPGLIDSTLFASLTPERVDAIALPDLESTTLDTGAASSVAVARLADLELAADDVGVVSSESVPGLFHSDLFRADVDIAAGAAAAGDVLEVSPAGARRPRPRTAARGGELGRVPCPACGTVHAAPRCPHCATQHPHAPST